MLDFGYYNMDCMQGMKEFPDGYFDLAIVDPPYGINVGSAPGGATLNGYRSEENEILRSNRRSNSVRKQIIVGGVSASHPKSIRRSMTATHRTPHILKNLSEWQKRELYGAEIIF